MVRLVVDPVEKADQDSLGVLQPDWKLVGEFFFFWEVVSPGNYATNITASCPGL